MAAAPMAAEAMESTAPAEPLAAAGALLAEAEAALDDPARAERLAASARDILIAQDDDPEGQSARLLFSSFALLVHCRRVGGKLEGAEEAAREALPFLCIVPAPSVGRARLLAAVAQLRRAERRLDEAAALFSYAAGLFREVRASQAEAACRAQAGLILLEQGATWRAGAEILRARRLLRVDLAPALVARVALLAAWCEVAAGQPERGERELSAARKLRQRTGDEREDLLGDWWEARIAAHDGRPADGDARLDAVRRRLLAEGSLREAAACTLDLLALRAAGRPEDTERLAADLFDAFRSPAALRPAELLTLLSSYARDRPDRYRSAVMPIRQALAAWRSEPGGRPDLIPPTEDLADRVLWAGRW